MRLSFLLKSIVCSPVFFTLLSSCTPTFCIDDRVIKELVANTPLPQPSLLNSERDLENFQRLENEYSSVFFSQLESGIKRLKYELWRKTKYQFEIDKVIELSPYGYFLRYLHNQQLPTLYRYLLNDQSKLELVINLEIFNAIVKLPELEQLRINNEHSKLSFIISGTDKKHLLLIHDLLNKNIRIIERNFDSCEWLDQINLVCVKNDIFNRPSNVITVNSVTSDQKEIYKEPNPKAVMLLSKNSSGKIFLKSSQSFTENIFEMSLDGIKNVPSTYYAANVEGQKRKIVFDRHEEVIFSLSSDNVKIPITVFPYKTTAQEPRPLLLIGYGAYGKNPDFTDSPLISVLIKRGWQVAFCHTRGGGYYGKNWHMQGAGINKFRSVEDFISCAKTLHEKSFSTPSQTVALGSSAGGLLVINSALKEPLLFKSVVGISAFLDPIQSLPQNINGWTHREEDEWGGPLTNEAKALSPLNININQNFPNLLLMTNNRDPVVPPINSSYFISLLRNEKSHNLRLLVTNNSAQHNDFGSAEEMQNTYSKIIGFLEWSVN